MVTCSPSAYPKLGQLAILIHRKANLLITGLIQPDWRSIWMPKWNVVSNKQCAQDIPNHMLGPCLLLMHMDYWGVQFLHSSIKHFSWHATMYKNVLYVTEVSFQKFNPRKCFLMQFIFSGKEPFWPALIPALGIMVKVPSKAPLNVMLLQQCWGGEHNWVYEACLRYKSWLALGLWLWHWMISFILNSISWKTSCAEPVSYAFLSSVRNAGSWHLGKTLIISLIWSTPWWACLTNWSQVSWGSSFNSQ